MLAKLYPNAPWLKSRPTPPPSAEKLIWPPPRTSKAKVSEGGHNNVLELNDCLSALTAVFPDVRPEVFREMLSTFSDASRLQLVTDCLLKNKAQWVRGRWRVPNVGGNLQGRRDDADLHPQDCFRTIEYKSAVKATLSQEFKGFSRSALKAVLAEHNHSYSDTRQALIALSSQSWRYSLAKILLRRKAISSADHPLIEWRVGKNGVRTPLLTSTKCPELDEELRRSFLAPLMKDQVKEQIEHDRQLAENINEIEAEETGAMFDCECCFTPYPFESITTCDTGGHFICSTCIRHTVSEAVYGQGWARSVESNRALLKCVAPGSTNAGECTGCISDNDLRRALSGEAAVDEILTRFEERIATECLLKSRLPLLKCPFCVYAEFEDISPPQSPQHKRDGMSSLATILICAFCFLTLLPNVQKFGSVCLAFILLIVASRYYLLPSKTKAEQLPLLPRHRHHGRKFTCRNPACSRISCLSCSATWMDVHVCYKSSRQALRTYVESAITDAVKRTCPQCNIAFVKSSGCNKLVCVCGYTMCYVCRSKIGVESYLHFCQHFRADAGQPCRECDKCDLYKVEEEEVVIRRAKDNAVKEWKEREGLLQSSYTGTENWNAEEEADGVGLKVMSQCYGS